MKRQQCKRLSCRYCGGSVSEETSFQKNWTQVRHTIFDGTVVKKYTMYYHIDCILKKEGLVYEKDEHARRVGIPAFLTWGPLPL